MKRTVNLILWSFLFAGFPPILPSEAASESSTDAKPKVLIIGTDHAPRCFFSAPGYTNAHLRIVLNHFKPTMIGIESNPVWMARGIVNRVTYESQVAIDWAAKDQIPVYGLDWAMLEELAEMNRVGLKNDRQLLLGG